MVDGDGGEVLTSYQALGRALLADEGVRGLVSRLARVLDDAVALVDLRGNVLAATPARARWPVDEIRAWRPGGSAERPCSVHVVPVEIGEDVVALLCTQRSRHDADLMTFTAGLVAADVARRQAVLAGRRELTGQVLQDVVRGVLPEREAERRLGSLGLALDQPHRVLVGGSDTSPERLRRFPWNLQTLMSGLEEPFLRATIGSTVVMIVSDSDAVPTVTRHLLSHMGELGRNARVGVGGARSGVPGLRLSYLEGQQAAEQGPGVHERSSLDLARLLLVADLGLPLEELARSLLRPLLDYDAEHGTVLLETLAVWLDGDCLPGPVVEHLFVHRNTVRYRLALVERLSGLDLSSFAVRMHLWFAIRSLDLTAVEDRAPALGTRPGGGSTAS